VTVLYRLETDLLLHEVFYLSVGQLALCNEEAHKGTE
jgi:hypothetical protein